MTRISEQAPEIRLCERAIEVQDIDGRELRGIVATFESPYDCGPFEEVLAPGVFDASLKRSGDNISLLDNHEGRRAVAGNTGWEKTDDALIGTWKFGTSKAAEEKLSEVRDGVVTGLSVGFAPDKREGASVWSDDG